MKIVVWRTSLRNKEHFQTLDGLRGLAAIAVMYFHRRWVAPETWHIFDHGYLAVDFFFMLSGFVIAYAYARRLQSGMTLREFFVCRVIRLYPMIVISVAIGAALVLTENHADLRVAITLAANALLLPFRDSSLTVPPFLSDVYFAANPPLYSLFFEVVINVIFAASIRFLTPSRTLIVIALSLVALVCLMRELAIPAMGQHPGLLVFFASGLARTAFSFFLGVALFQYRERLPRLRVNPNLIAVSVLAVFLTFRLPGQWDEVFNLAVVSVAFPTLIAIGSVSEPSGFSAKLAALLGALSYPVYALHTPLYGWYDRLHLLRYRASLVFAVSAVILAAYALLKLYDEPLRRSLNDLRRRRNAARLAASPTSEHLPAEAGVSSRAPPCAFIR